ncbi:hypothetical protein DPMN_159348 [Dreissena polymorpha]|uniref:Uncharacterized protein n=1 Tax=Dreissena polymorpha TaxID=45954 RepID=A0A9D4IRQ1_DREPO|nr:hypothetical protein DPMN_159348 [Dreissena polymorpha]
MGDGVALLGNGCGGSVGNGRGFGYLNNGRLMRREECSVDDWTRQVAVEVVEEFGKPVPEVFTCVPLNSPGVIFQYRIMLEVMSLLTLEQHLEFLAHFSSEQWSDPVYEGMEADVSSTSADGSPDEEVGVEKRIEEEDGVSSTSADAHKAVIASESLSTSPRRPWLPGRSLE